MTTDFIAGAAFAALGLLWLLVNIKVRSTPARVVSYLLMWASFLAATFVVVRAVWGLL